VEKLPKKLKIGGYDVPITFPHHFSDDSSITAIADTDKPEIRISDRDSAGELKSEDRLWHDLFHEVNHFVDRLLGHELFQDTDEDENKRKDRINDALAHMWYMVLKDNNLLKKPK